MVELGIGSQKFNRRSVRLKEYDYSQAGAYFVTMRADNQKCLFGRIEDGTVCLNEIGAIVHSEWLRSESIRSEIELDAFVVMPNHLHAIALIQKNETILQRAHGRAPLHREPRSLSSFVAGFKAAASREINRFLNTPGKRVWQRNYTELL